MAEHIDVVKRSEYERLRKEYKHYRRLVEQDNDLRSKIDKAIKEMESNLVGLDTWNIEEKREYYTIKECINILKGNLGIKEKEQTSNNNPPRKNAALYLTGDTNYSDSLHYFYIYESDNERDLKNSIGVVGYYIYDKDGNMLDGGECEYFEKKSFKDFAREILFGSGYDPSIFKEYSFSEIVNPDGNILSSENDIEWETLDELIR